MKWDHLAYLWDIKQFIHKGLAHVSSVYLILSSLVNQRTVQWKESQPAPILQTRQLKPLPLLPEWSTGRGASFKSEDEERTLRKGLGRWWLPWAVISAVGCLHLDFLLHEKNNHHCSRVSVTCGQHTPNRYRCVHSFSYPLTERLGSSSRVPAKCQLCTQQYPALMGYSLRTVQCLCDELYMSSHLVFTVAL